MGPACTSLLWCLWSFLLNSHGPLPLPQLIPSRHQITEATVLPRPLWAPTFCTGRCLGGIAPHPSPAQPQCPGVRVARTDLEVSQQSSTALGGAQTPHLNPRFMPHPGLGYLCHLEQLGHCWCKVAESGTGSRDTEGVTQPSHTGDTHTQGDTGQGRGRPCL